MTRLSRWFGVLEVAEGPFEDSSPIFHEANDPFTVRFRVKTRVWLPAEQAVPIHDHEVWQRLTFTREHSQATSSWTGKVRSSLVALDEQDGRFLEELLNR